MESYTIKEIDLSKDSCPVNYLKAKLELSKLEPNNKLKLIFSDLRVAQTVKKSLEKDGFTSSDISSMANTFFFFVKNSNQ